MHTLYIHVVGFILFLYNLLLCDVDTINTYVLLIVNDTQCVFNFSSLIVILYGL